ncbi:MAG: hypothetical protein LBG22_02535 [Treponema sp.]|nr:hypothetical protein [Treponema sp.]
MNKSIILIFLAVFILNSCSTIPNATVENSTLLIGKLRSDKKAMNILSTTKRPVFLNTSEFGPTRFGSGVGISLTGLLYNSINAIYVSIYDVKSRKTIFCKVQKGGFFYSTDLYNGIYILKEIINIDADGERRLPVNAYFYIEEGKINSLIINIQDERYPLPNFGLFSLESRREVIDSFKEEFYKKHSKTNWVQKEIHSCLLVANFGDRFADVYRFMQYHYGDKQLAVAILGISSDDMELSEYILNYFEMDVRVRGYFTGNNTFVPKLLPDDIDFNRFSDISEEEAIKLGKALDADIVVTGVISKSKFTNKEIGLDTYRILNFKYIDVRNEQQRISHITLF